MGLGRWFAKRAARKGNFGGTARTIGKQYEIMRGAHPATPRPEILRQIIEFRHAILPYSAAQKARLCCAAAANPTLAEFVMEIVLAEADTYEHELGGMAQVSREVVREELEKLGLHEEIQEATSSSPEALLSDESATREPDLSEVRAGLATQSRMLALLQHTAGGIPLVQIPGNSLRAHLEICATEFGLKVPTEVREGIRLVGGSQALPADVMESLTGQAKTEWAAVFRKHRESVEAVVSGRAEVWGLPDEIWSYLTAMTGRSPEQWKALPEEVAALIRGGLKCPSCRTHFAPRNVIHAAGEGKTYLGKENPDTLHFRCPRCSKHFTWNVATGATALQD